MNYTTLLWCGSVDSGPVGCCGCFNGRQNGRHIEFYCNECGRVVFDATPRRADNGDAGGEQAVLLGTGPADAITDADAATLRDARAGDAVHEGGLT